MSNMSHCRYENTARDLRDCYEDLADESPDTLSERLSASELRAAVRLVTLCMQIAATMGVKRNSDRLTDLAIERLNEDN